MQNSFYRSTFKLNIINISVTPSLEVVEPYMDPTSWKVEVYNGQSNSYVGAYGSLLYVNILRPEQDTTWPAAEHIAYILLDPDFF
jgi:hypothetical protein